MDDFEVKRPLFIRKWMSLREVYCSQKKANKGLWWLKKHIHLVPRSFSIASLSFSVWIMKGNWVEPGLRSPICIAQTDVHSLQRGSARRGDLQLYKSKS